MRGARIVAIVAGLWAAFIGTWGLVTHSSTRAVDGDVQSMGLWIAIALVTLAVAVVASSLAQRRS